MDQSAEGRVERVQIEAVVIRADGTKEPLGVVSDSALHWRYGPGRLMAALRTRRANRHLKES
jgi:hypothetical protein